jgi:DNA-binding transcriptional regulator YiaG
MLVLSQLQIIEIIKKGDVIMSATKTKKGDVTMTKENKKLPKRLKKYRMDSGYTIYSLADRLDVNFSSVSYWENGQKFPRPGKMMELEEIFGVGYRDLFTDLTEKEAIDLEQRKYQTNHSEKEKEKN